MASMSRFRSGGSIHSFRCFRTLGLRASGIPGMRKIPMPMCLSKRNGLFRKGVDNMVKAKPVKDRFPYTATWDGYTKEQQRKVRSEANKARLPLWEIIALYVKSGQQP